MKKTWIIIIAVIAVIAVYGVSSYNSMVSQEEAVGTAWSNVENQYQRRADLIPNLVNTVKGYAAHEKETFDAVVSARAKATQTTVSIDDLTPEKMEAYQRAQGEVGSALSRLLAVTENYPELQRCGTRIQYIHPPLPEKYLCRHVRIRKTSLLRSPGRYRKSSGS